MTSQSLLSSVARTVDSELPWDTNGEYGGWGGGTWERTRPDDALHPVVFVHGNQRDASDWETHRQRFKNSGYTDNDLWAITFKQSMPTHDEMKRQLDDFVRNFSLQTDSREIVIIAHSLGVTGVRHWLHTSTPSVSVAGFIALAGANHGIGYATLWCQLGLSRGSGSVSHYLRSDYEQFDSHPLQSLNADETPHDFPYFTLRGAHDALFSLNPDSPRLEGAVENAVLETDHDGVRVHPKALQKIDQWVAYIESGSHGGRYDFSSE